MQQFTVPQFIDVEDKIIGSITARQFVIMLAAFLLMAIFYRIFDISLFATLSVITFVVFGTFAFAKVNGRPFHFFVLNLIQTLKKSKFRVWNNQLRQFEINIEIPIEDFGRKYAPKAEKISSSRLTELSLVVDTGGGYGGEKGGNRSKTGLNDSFIS